MKHRISLKAHCPHYLHEDRQVIYCTGIKEGTVTHIAFANGRDAYEYKNNHCYKHEPECAVKDMLDEVTGDE